MRGRSAFLLALGLALVSALPAHAMPGTLDAHAALPLEVQGAHTARASDGQVLVEGASGHVTFLLQDATGVAERVIHRAFGYVNTMDPKAEVVWKDDVDRVDLPLDGAALRLTERRGGFRLLAYDGAASLSGPADAPLLVGALDTARTVDYQLDSAIAVHVMPPDVSDRFSEVLPAGSFQVRGTSGHIGLDGPFELFLYDAQVEHALGAQSQVLPIHFRIEERPGAIYNPLSGSWTGPGTHTEYIQEYLLLHVTSGRLDVLFSGLPGALYAGRPSLDIDGSAILPDTTGTVTVDDDGKITTHTIRGQDLTLAGRFTLEPSLASDGFSRAKVTGNGDLTQVSYGAVSESYDWTTLAAVGAGAAVLAVGAWLALNGKALLGSGGALLAGYARVHGEEILQHPGRQEVYERVKAQPGVNFVDLQAQLPFGASTLTYHLRVLEKNEYVMSQKDGRYIRFFDKRSGLYSSGRKVAVSALRNPNTAAIAHAIVKTPGVAQRDLAAQFSVSASTVSWHINRLQQAGLVERQRDAQHTRYYAGQAWASLPADEQAKFGHAMAV